MRKRVFLTAVCLVVLSLFVGTMQPVQVAKAQQPAVVDDYVVKKGDTTYDLSGTFKKNPMRYKEIVKKNPELVITTGPVPGWDYVMIHPGQHLKGLTTSEIAAISGGAGGVSSSGSSAPNNPPDKGQGSSGGGKTETKTAGINLWWIVLPLLLIAAFIALYAWLRRRGRNAANLGPRFVPEGVTPQNAHAAMRAAAQRTYHRERPFAERTNPNDFRIISMTAGRLYGLLRVLYADGSERPAMFWGEHGYSAEVQFPDGRREMLYMLQPCANELRMYGTRRIPGLGFRFVPDVRGEITEPVAQSVTTQTPSATAAAATQAPQAVQQPTAQAAAAAVGGSGGSGTGVPSQGITTSNQTSVPAVSTASGATGSGAAGTPSETEDGGSYLHYSAANRQGQPEQIRMKGLSFFSIEDSEKEEGETIIRFRRRTQ